MEDKSDSRTAAGDGGDGLMLVIAPVLLALTMLVTAAAFAGGGVQAPVELELAAKATPAARQRQN